MITGSLTRANIRGLPSGAIVAATWLPRHQDATRSPSRESAGSQEVDGGEPAGGGGGVAGGAAGAIGGMVGGGVDGASIARTLVTK